MIRVCSGVCAVWCVGMSVSVGVSVHCVCFESPTTQLDSYIEI